MNQQQLPGQVRQIGAGFGRPTTVRLSIDVPADLHQAFGAWRSQTALDLGRGVVSVQDSPSRLVKPDRAGPRPAPPRYGYGARGFPGRGQVAPGWERITTGAGPSSGIR